MAKYIVEILDSALQPLTRINAFVPLNTKGDILKYSDILSGVGECHFRVATREPVLVKYGDVLQPYANHVRVMRDGKVVWQGLIIDCPERNDRYIEVKAVKYLYLLQTRLIKHDAETVAGDGKDQYRTISSGTLSTFLTNILNETKSTSQGALAGMTVGTIENPDFPAGFTKVDKTPLTGAWTFSSDMTLQFSYAPILQVISQLGIYAVADFEMTPNLTFNWYKKMGTDKTNLVFSYGKYGNIESFNAPLYGSRMVNNLVGVAADVDGNILHSLKPDSASITKYGTLDGTAGFKDVSNQNALVSRTVQELNLVSTPDAEVHAVLKQSAYPYGTYALGDTVTFAIALGPINTSVPRRIIGIEVVVHNTGEEHIKLSTNKPRA